MNQKLQKKLQDLSKMNKTIFFKKNKNEGILYFDEQFVMTTNNNNIDKTQMNILSTKLQENKLINLGEFCYSVRVHLPLDKFNISLQQYDNPLVILINSSKKINANLHNICNLHEFYQQLYKDFIQCNLFKYFGYFNKLDYNKLQQNLKTYQFDETIIQLLCDYLTINICIFTNKSIQLFSKNFKYTTFLPTFLLYFDTKNNKYHYIIDTNTNNSILFVNSVQQHYWTINYKLLKKQLQTDILNYIPIFKKNNTMRHTKSYYTSKRITKLREICDKYNISTINSQNQKLKKNILINRILAEYNLMLYNIYK